LYLLALFFYIILAVAFFDFKWNSKLCRKKEKETVNKGQGHQVKHWSRKDEGGKHRWMHDKSTHNNTNEYNIVLI